MGFNRTIRHEEEVFEDDKQIAVISKGVWKDATQLKLPHTYGKVLEITSNNGEAVYVSDDPSTTKQKVRDGYDSRRAYDDVSRYKR